MDFLDDMGVSKLSAKVFFFFFFKLNYSFNINIRHLEDICKCSVFLSHQFCSSARINHHTHINTHTTWFFSILIHYSLPCCPALPLRLAVKEHLCAIVPNIKVILSGELRSRLAPFWLTKQSLLMSISCSPNLFPKQLGQAWSVPT